MSHQLKSSPRQSRSGADGAGSPAVGWPSAMRPYYWYLAVGFVLALLPPNDVLTAVPSLRAISQVLAAIIPSIDRIAAISSFPEVTKLFLAIMWVLQPIVTLVALRRVPRPDQARVRAGWPVVVVGLPVMFFLLVYLPFVFIDVTPKDLGYTAGRGRAYLTMITQSRLGLAAVGSLALVASSLAQVLIVQLILSLAVGNRGTAR